MIVLLFGFLWVSAQGDASTGCSMCKYQRVHGMQSADCYNTGLRDVPQCLKTNIEVLDLSYNRIRKVRKNDLEKYTSLKYLYLTDNMITDIEEEAVSGKTSLETLDISYNSFSAIPNVIFKLPSLKRLYMSQNHNTNIAEEIDKSVPILSPLIMLDIGYNTIKELPNLGEVPTLVYYNISGNQDVLMKISHFAGLCMLKTLVMQNFTSVFDDPCHCVIIRRWLDEREVILIDNFNCKNIDCPYVIPEEDLETHKKCLEKHTTQVMRSTLLTMVLPGSIFIFIVVCIVILYVYKRRAHKRRRRSEMERLRNLRPLYKEPLM